MNKTAYSEIDTTNLYQIRLLESATGSLDIDSSRANRISAFIVPFMAFGYNAFEDIALDIIVIDTTGNATIINSVMVYQEPDTYVFDLSAIRHEFDAELHLVRQSERDMIINRIRYNVLMFFSEGELLIKEE